MRIADYIGWAFAALIFTPIAAMLAYIAVTTLSTAELAVLGVVGVLALIAYGPACLGQGLDRLLGLHRQRPPIN